MPPRFIPTYMCTDLQEPELHFAQGVNERRALLAAAAGASTTIALPTASVAFASTAIGHNTAAFTPFLLLPRTVYCDVGGLVLGHEQHTKLLLFHVQKLRLEPAGLWTGSVFRKRRRVHKSTKVSIKRIHYTT